ncbi:hypothetical protein [Halorubrum sp. DTA98]|uniref:hypothetical protein n=1 Tax=Halorubrum sp. DTA98 TaxID=3402163 RepID=UPI003AAAB51F
MDDRFPDGLSGAVAKANSQSDKALYRYLRLHIFGPYSGDCEAFLNEVKLKLQDNEFEQAKICSDRDDSPPDGASPREKAEFWHEVSYDFADHADVAVFFILENELDRANVLPDRAFKDEPYGDGPPREEINSSVIQEMNYWLREIDIERERTLVLFEGEMANKIGPVFRGEVTTEEIDVQNQVELDLNDFDLNDTERAVEYVHGLARNWAMNTCKLRLQDRYLSEANSES